MEPIKDSLVIGSLLPHSGDMCLLDSVVNWNENSIECRASSHRNCANPLRHQEVLPIQAGIEYLAQAMAIHGTLCEQRAGRPRSGYLTVLTNVDWYCSRLDDLPRDLRALARKLLSTEGGLNYSFSLYHEQRLLLEGQAVVALQDLAR